MLQEFCANSVVASDLTRIHVKNTVTCNSCLQSNTTEDPLMILQLPVSKSVQNAIDLFLKPEELSGQNSYFCNVCDSLQAGLLDHELSRTGDFLVVQLKRFINLLNSVTKDRTNITYNNQIKIPVAVDNEITSRKLFKLVGIINHSGSLERGHYTAQIFDANMSQ